MSPTQSPVNQAASEVLEVQPAARWWIEEVLLGSTVAKSIGLELVDLAVDSVRMRLPFDEHLVTHGTTVHGGVLATAVDIAGSAASASGVQGEASGGATSILDLTYLASVDGVDVTLTADVDLRTATRTVSVVRVHDEERTYARGTVDSRIFRPRS